VNESYNEMFTISNTSFVKIEENQTSLYKLVSIKHFS